MQKMNFSIMQELILIFINGKINFNKTKFINYNIGTLELNNSNLFLKNNELVF